MSTIWRQATMKDLILNAEIRKKDPDFWATVDKQLSGTFKGPVQETGGTVYHSYKWRSFPGLQPVKKSRPVPHVLDYPSEIPKADDEGFVWPVANYCGHRPDGWIRSEHPNRRARAEPDSYPLQTKSRPSTQAAAAADMDFRPSAHAGPACVDSAPAASEFGQVKDDRLEELVDMARAEAARGAAAQQLAAVRQRSEGSLLRGGAIPGEELDAARMADAAVAAATARPFTTEPARARSQHCLGGQVGSLLEVARTEAKRGAAAHQLSAMRQHGQGTIVRQDRQHQRRDADRQHQRRDAALKEQQRLRAAYSSMSR